MMGNHPFLSGQKCLIKHEAGEKVMQQEVNLRGAPSAISMAVIPKDQISLCKADGKVSVIRSYSLVHTYTLLQNAAVTLKS